MLDSLYRYYTVATDFESDRTLDVLNHPEYSNSNATTVELAYPHEDNLFIEITQRDFKVKANLSSKIKISNPVKLSGTVSVEQLKVYDSICSLLPQRRTIKYEDNPTISDFPATRFSSYKSDTITVAKIPAFEGTVDLKSVEAGLTNFTGSGAQTLVTSRLVGKSRGLIPRSYLLEVPELLYTPDTFARGILLAIASKDDQLVISQLNEFIYIAELANWIYLDDDNQVQVTAEPVWGLEPTFSDAILKANGVSGPKEIWSNALLGLAVTTAIKFLQDRWPLNSTKLYGSRGDYQERLLAALKALALFCSYSVSPLTGWAAYKFEQGEYTYDQPSRIASYITDLFLGEYLTISYDSVINFLAFSLHKVIKDVDANPTRYDYSSFVERDFQTIFSIKEPPELYSVPELADAYTRAGIAGYKYLWAVLNNVTNTTPLLTTYEQAREEYFEFTAQPAYKLEYDFLVDWVASCYEDRVLADWQVALRSSVNEADIESIAFDWYALNYLAESNSIVFNYLPEGYDTRSTEAFLTNSLQELKRLWPFGYRWTGSEFEDDPNSVIGSIFYAESNINLYNALAEKVLTQNSAPITAGGESLDQWTKLLATSLNISSNEFTRSWLKEYLNTRNSIENLFTDVFGYDSAVVSYIDPSPFCLLESPTAADEHTSYSQPVNELNRNSFGTAGYFSCAYKPSSGFKVSNIDYLTSFAEPLNQDLGLQLRKVPGFPQLYPRVSYHDILTSSEESVANGLRITEDQIVSPEDYVPGMPNVWVQDTAVLIDPLYNYIPKEVVRLPNRAVPFLVESVNRTQAAGIQRIIQTSYISVSMSASLSTCLGRVLIPDDV
jgi:hypothetical protein